MSSIDKVVITHHFTGMLLHIKDDEQTRELDISNCKDYFFKNRYHHYAFYCKEVYVYGGRTIAHLYVNKKLEGKQGSSGIDRELKEQERINIRVDLLSLYLPNNKELAYTLLKFKEEID